MERSVHVITKQYIAEKEFYFGKGWESRPLQSESNIISSLEESQMPTLREYALDAWSREDEKQKASEQKKRKRKAKKIEEEIEELLPRELKEPGYERNLDDATFGVVVSVIESDGTLRFTRDEKDNLVIIGECPQCKREALSRHIDQLEDLGQALKAFEAGPSHSCPTKAL